ncbi:MAG: T9SS type A sorting domain-containing protein [Rhodothermales bacterium]
MARPRQLPHARLPRRPQPGLRGSLYGTQSSLQSGALYGGDPRFTTNYRDVYSTVLRDWFGLPTERIEGILEGSFNTLNFVDDKITVGREATPVPHTIRLDQNYPNPFNASTRLTYSLSQGGPVRLHVFDIRGRLVRVLADHAHVPGIYTLDFDGHGLPSGAYLYRLETPAGSQTRRMVLVK